MSEVPKHECTPESLPAGARHISVARYGDLTCRDGIAAVESAKAEVEVEVEVEAEAEAEAEAEVEEEEEADGGPSSVDDIGRLEPSTLDPQRSKQKEEGGVSSGNQSRTQILHLHCTRRERTHHRSSSHSYPRTPQRPPPPASP